MEILIVGGGIGGLTLALSVHAANPGARIKVFEAAPDIRALGVGINIGPHAVKELSALGLEDALAAVACLPQDYAFFTRQGQLVYREPWGKAAGHQWPHISIHRGELHQVLLDAVRERIGPENFITGHRCVAVEQDDAAVTARFTDPDGKSLPPQRGDILVACDGIHSAVRAQFYPDEGPFSFRGTNLWRGVTRRPPDANPAMRSIRTNPLRLWGPTGLDRVARGLRTAAKADIDIRTADEKVNNAAARFETHPFARDGVIFDEAGVKVTAFAVDHGALVKPAYGYRVDYAGHAVLISGDTRLSVAHMRSPSGWAEPGQRPEFDEFTIVLRGALVVESEGGQMTVHAGQGVHTRPGEWVRYSTPGADGAEYISVCVPAFAPDTVHRDA